MPDIGYFHPLLVHFAIVLCGIGVAFRVVSLTGRWSWTHPTAVTLLVAGAITSIFTAHSGKQAHGPVERIPGARDAVIEHEEWGERARNIFLVVAALELVGLSLRGQEKAARIIRVGSALAGLGGIFVLYEAGEHGADLVYEYAGGPGIRSGDTTDVTRLLIAGLYHRAMADRAAGDKEGAARLFDELVRRSPNDPSVAMLGLESRIKDRGDAAGGLEVLRAMAPAPNDARAKLRRGVLMADAYRILGHVDSARAILEELKREFPTSRGVADGLKAIQH